MKHFLAGAMTRFAIAAMFCSLSWSAHALADNTAKRAINIPAQNLSSALQELSKQSGESLIYRPEQVKGFRTVGVVGTFSAEQAATKLVEGTPLKVSMDATGALLIAIQLPAAAFSQGSPATEARKEGKTPSSAGFHMAQMDEGAPAGPTAVNPPTQQSRSQYPENQLQEVIVTAQKRPQRELDVPISLVVLSSQELQKRQIDTPDDLQYVVPGLVIESGGVLRRMYMRGVSNFTGNGASIGEYVDDADVTPASGNGNSGLGTLDTRMYDLQRVEVLRGPQGTLFGEGAIGGVIRFITNQPVLDRFQMSSDVAAMFTQDGAPSQRIEAMLNTPLVTDTLGLRFAGEFEHNGGWIDQPAANLKNINSQNLVDVRIEGSWQPTARFSAYLMQVIHRNDYGLSEGEDAGGNWTEPVFPTLTRTAEENSGLSNLTLTYDFDQAQLLSSTTYYKHTLTVSNRAELFGDLGGFIFVVPYSVSPEEDASEELRLSRTKQGAWQWTVGSFYKHFSSAFAYPNGTLVGFSSPLAVATPDYLTVGSSKSWSAFGDTSYRLFGSLTAGAGIRYFSDQESQNGSYSSPQEKTFTSTDPRVYLRYGVTSDISVYASAAKGFRTGGFNGLGLPPYHPESLWSYELGTKMLALDRRLSINADVFYSDYSNYLVLGNYQAFGTIFSTVANTGTVRIKGVEGQLVWRPDNDWQISFNGEALSSKFVAVNVQGTQYHVGSGVDFVPDYSFTASLERDFHLAGRSEYTRLDYSQIGRESFTPPCAPCIAPYGPIEYSDVINMLSLNSGIQWNESLRLGVFAENLLNDRGNLNSLGIQESNSRPQPRTFGVEFGIKFK